MTLTSRNPCPKCGKPPQHIAGIVAFGSNSEKAAHGSAFLVCWGCKCVARVRRADLVWRTMSEMKKRVREATKHG